MIYLGMIKFYLVGEKCAGNVYTIFFFKLGGDVLFLSQSDLLLH